MHPKKSIVLELLIKHSFETSYVLFLQLRTITSPLSSPTSPTLQATYEGVNPKTARVSTARASRASRRVQADIVDIKQQLERLEEQRRMDTRQLERLIREIGTAATS